MLYQWGRKDCFPGADGSTIQSDESAITTIPIYGADGITALKEDETGYQKISIKVAEVLNGNTSQIYSIKNPLTFIYNATAPNDWYTDVEIYQNKSLWNSDTKSIYDPCPKNWCISRDATWKDFSFENAIYYTPGEYNPQNGLCYNKYVWYPAIGRRLQVAGTLASSGYGGNYWSYTTGDEYPTYFNFNAALSLIPVGKNPLVGCAFGYAVRCVQE